MCAAANSQYDNNFHQLPYATPTEPSGSHNNKYVGTRRAGDFWLGSITWSWSLHLVDALFELQILAAMALDLPWAFDWPICRSKPGDNSTTSICERVGLRGLAREQNWKLTPPSHGCHVEIESFGRHGLRLAAGIQSTQPKRENYTTISTKECTGPISNHWL